MVSTVSIQSPKAEKGQENGSIMALPCRWKGFKRPASMAGPGGCFARGWTAMDPSSNGTDKASRSKVSAVVCQAAEAGSVRCADTHISHKDVNRVIS